MGSNSEESTTSESCPEASTEDCAKNGYNDGKKANVNTDALSDGQLLIEFFEFYGYNFDNERLAIDIRHYHQSSPDAHAKPAPYRPREDFIAEA